jgi:iron complex transport system permease protein
MQRIGVGDGPALERHAAVLEQIRLPRVALAIVVGAALGAAGAAMQGLFRNPLADPALVGASAGASLAVAIVIVAGGWWVEGFTRTFGLYALPAAAFAGCVAATLAVRRLAATPHGVSVGAMLLAGVAINVLCEAAIAALSFSATDEQLRNLTFWRMGSLAGASWPLIGIALGCGLAGAALLAGAWRGLDALALGEEAARHAGIDPDALSRRVVAASALMVAAAVASAGMVWFVGLVAPHMVRLLGGPGHRFTLPGAALAGAAATLAADSVARTVAIPAELPLGVPLAFLGAPLFVGLLVRARDRGAL